MTVTVGNDSMANVCSVELDYSYHYDTVLRIQCVRCTCLGGIRYLSRYDVCFLWV